MTQALSLPANDSLLAHARNVARQIILVGNRTYTSKDAALIAELLAQDKPSRNIDDAFYWAWFNARRTISYAAWDSFIAAIFARDGAKATKTELARKGYVKGRLDSATQKELHSIYHAIAPHPFEGDDFRPGYFFDPNMTQDISHERDLANECRKPTPQLLRVLEGWLKREQNALEEIMGHPWRVVSTHLFSLRGRTKLGPDHTHLDGWPVGIRKIMIYLGPTGLKDGSTELFVKGGGTFHVEGPPGEWVLFENSALEHRAISPQSNPRPILEISIVPALVTDTTCVDAGMNGGYPWFPTELSAAGSTGNLDDYVQAAEVRLYLRALHLALGAQEMLRGSMSTEHKPPTTGKFVRALPRRTILALHRVRRLLKTGL